MVEAQERAAAGAATADDGEDALLTLQPKKANWDLQRDVERKLAKLEKRTQRAVVELLRQEELKRMGGEAPAS